MNRQTTAGVLAIIITTLSLLLCACAYGGNSTTGGVENITTLPLSTSMDETNITEPQLAGQGGDSEASVYIILGGPARYNEDIQHQMLKVTAQGTVDATEHWDKYVAQYYAAARDYGRWCNTVDCYKVFKVYQNMVVLNHAGLFYSVLAGGQEVLYESQGGIFSNDLSLYLRMVGGDNELGTPVTAVIFECAAEGETGQLEPLTREAQAIEPIVFSPDNTKVIYKDHANEQVWYIDIATGEIKNIDELIPGFNHASWRIHSWQGEVVLISDMAAHTTFYYDLYYMRFAELGRYMVQPVLSEDGSLLAYSRPSPREYTFYSQEYSDELYDYFANGIRSQQYDSISADYEQAIAGEYGAFLQKLNTGEVTKIAESGWWPACIFIGLE